MNSVTLVGNIVADPKGSIISNGNEKSSFTIAVRDSKNYNETYFISCVAWSPVSSFINTNVKKGDLVSINGRLVRRSYTPVDGKVTYITEVVVDTFETLRRAFNNFANNDTNVTRTVHADSSCDVSSKPEITESTNIDAVFTNSNNNSHVAQPQEEDDGDDIDWDSEFN